jgi:hypothetical protein
MDLLERDLDRRLDELRALGTTALSVASAYHPVEAILPANPRRRWLVLPESLAFFPLEARRFGRLRPRVSREVSIEPIRDALVRHDLALTAWIVLTHTSLAARHRREAARLPGGRVHRAALCPARPAVQEYLVALVQEAERVLAPAVIDLESLGWNTAPNVARVKVAVPLSPVASYLAALCLCTSCTTRADRALVAWIERAFSEALNGRWAAEPLDRFLEERPDLAGFQRRRESATASVLRAIRAGSNARLHLVHWSDLRISGIDGTALDGLVDRYTVLAYGSDASWVGRTIADARRWLGPRRTVAGLSLQAQETPRRSTWRAVHGVLADAGIRSWSIYNHSLVDPRRLAWLADGVPER